MGSHFSFLYLMPLISSTSGRGGSPVRASTVVGGQVGLEGVHAGGDEGEVFGAEVVGLDAATELLVLPVHLGAEVFDFHPAHALHF